MNTSGWNLGRLDRVNDLYRTWGEISINVVPEMESVGVKKLFRLVQQKPNAWKRLEPFLLLLMRLGF